MAAQGVISITTGRSYLGMLNNISIISPNVIILPEKKFEPIIGSYRLMIERTSTSPSTPFRAPLSFGSCYFFLKLSTIRSRGVNIPQLKKWTVDEALESLVGENTSHYS